MPKWQNFRGKKPTNNPKWPSTQAQVDLRVTEVWKLLVDWYPRFEIVWIIKNKYSISSQQIDKYIKTAKERIREKSKETLEDDIALTDMMISEVYRSAKEEKKRNSMLRALKLKMELKWLNLPKRNNIPFIDNSITEEEQVKVNELLKANGVI